MRVHLVKIFFLFFLSGAAQAAPGPWSAGGGLGVAIPVGVDSFRERTGISFLGSIWGRRSFAAPLSLELGYDRMEFKNLGTGLNYIGPGLLITFEGTEWIPTLLLGMGMAEVNSQIRVGFKARAGIERLIADSLTFGGSVNYHYTGSKPPSPKIHVLSLMLGVNYSFGSN